MTPLSDVRGCIGALRSALAASDTEILLGQVPALVDAIEKMKLLLEVNASRDELCELRNLSRDLEACRKLIHRGSATLQILAGILISVSAGYGRNGVPAVQATTSTLSFRG